MKKTLIPMLLLAVALAACGDVDTNEPPDTTPQDQGSAPADWIRGEFFVADADLVILESFPIQVRLEVDGELPTPCHIPTWNVDDDGTTLVVTLESATAPDAICSQVLEPTQVGIDLGSFSEGSRIVTLNGEEVGTFSA